MRALAFAQALALALAVALLRAPSHPASCAAFAQIAAIVLVNGKSCFTCLRGHDEKRKRKANLKSHVIQAEAQRTVMDCIAVN